MAYREFGMYRTRPNIFSGLTGVDRRAVRWHVFRVRAGLVLLELVGHVALLVYYTGLALYLIFPGALGVYGIHVPLLPHMGRNLSIAILVGMAGQFIGIVAKKTRARVTPDLDAATETADRLSRKRVDKKSV